MARKVEKCVSFSEGLAPLPASFRGRLILYFPSRVFRENSAHECGRRSKYAEKLFESSHSPHHRTLDFVPPNLTPTPISETNIFTPSVPNQYRLADHLHTRVP